MAYTYPEHDEVDESWVGDSGYSHPPHDAVDESWLDSVAAVGSGEVEIGGAGVGLHGVRGAGIGDIIIDGLGTGSAGMPAVVATGSGEIDIEGAGIAQHGARGPAVGDIEVSGGGAGKHGVRAVGAGEIAVIGAAAGLHLRYELRGEVRLAGVLVNRRVRAYRRDTGALTGEADTVAGRFRVPAGVGAVREHYVVPIDLGEDATDWRPPVANRVMSVLASDTA